MKTWPMPMGNQSQGVPSMDDTPSQPGDHPLNQPVTQMGQEMVGIQPSKYEIARSSPMTEASLDLLGAGSAYKQRTV